MFLFVLLVRFPLVMICFSGVAYFICWLAFVLFTVSCCFVLGLIIVYMYDVGICLIVLIFLIFLVFCIYY